MKKKNLIKYSLPLNFVFIKTLYYIAFKDWVK